MERVKRETRSNRSNPGRAPAAQGHPSDPAGAPGPGPAPGWRLDAQLLGAAAAGDIEGCREALARGARLGVMRLRIERRAKLPAALQTRIEDLNLLDGRSPLMAAAEGDHADAVELLLDAGAPIEASEAGGFTALLLAVVSNAKGAAAALLSRGADVQARSACGQSALHWACVCRSPELAAALLEAGAPVDARDHDGWTPLMAAAQWASVGCFDALLRGGADWRARNRDGRDALHFASDARAHAGVGAPAWRGERERERAAIVERLRALEDERVLAAALGVPGRDAGSGPAPGPAIGPGRRRAASERQVVRL